MNQQNAAGCCGGRQASLIPIDRDKWGRCPLCIALAAAGAIMGWSFTLSFWLLFSDPRIVLGLAGVALCFTVVLALHVIAHLVRSARQNS
jgi:uncharacterized membrane protein